MMHIRYMPFSPILLLIIGISFFKLLFLNIGQKQKQQSQIGLQRKLSAKICGTLLNFLNALYLHG